jgi:acylphosphatase
VIEGRRQTGTWYRIVVQRIAKHAVVSGIVQGVAFRWYAKERARELGLAGWVRNLPDGRVEARFEGPTNAVDEFVAWLGHGPPSARVDGVELEEDAPSGAERFEVRR